MSPTRPEAGFSLIEVLVALAVAGLAVSGLVGFVMQASRFDTALNARSLAREEIDGVLRVLEVLIDDAAEEMRESTAAAIAGDRRSIRIMTKGPRILGTTRPSLFELSYEEKIDGPGRIVLAWSDPITNAVRREEVSREIAEFSLSYASWTRPLNWETSWTRPVIALSLVRIDLMSSRTRQRSTKFFPVAPSFPPTCVVNLFAKGCPKWPR